MNRSLIIDVGMHTGRDTELYLKKGFDVVAVEANPELVRKAGSLFHEALSEGRLIIHDVAIADHEGEIEFYVNEQHDDWGMTSNQSAARNEGFGTTNKQIRVQCAPFQQILRQHGIPYYLKIDIEGADVLCLKALADFAEKPTYVSIEASLKSFEETFEELSLLWNLGYRRFKIVNQAMNKKVKCPNPPLEGSYVDYRFDATCSGPFGEEAPGEWMSVEETIVRYRRLLWEQKYFGAAGRLYKRLIQRLYELLKGEKAGWYDIHAGLVDCGNRRERLAVPLRAAACIGLWETDGFGPRLRSPPRVGLPPWRRPRLQPHTRRAVWPPVPDPWGLLISVIIGPKPVLL